MGYGGMIKLLSITDRQFIDLRRKVTWFAKQSVSILNPFLPSKVIWKNIKSSGVRDSVDDNVIYSRVKLGSYYESLCSVALPVTAHVMFARTDEARFSFINVNAMEVYRTIFQIKSNAVGLDGISLKCLKLILTIILPCVLHMFNAVLTSSTFLLSGKYLKLSKFRKEKTITPNTPRILPTKSKAMEIGMRDKMVVFVDNFSLLDFLQSSFQSKHGTTSMLKVTSDIQFGCDRKLMTVPVCM
jgi:hypothetical protein